MSGEPLESQDEAINQLIGEGLGRAKAMHGHRRPRKAANGESFSLYEAIDSGDHTFKMLFGAGFWAMIATGAAVQSINIYLCNL